MSVTTFRTDGIVRSLNTSYCSTVATDASLKFLQCKKQFETPTHETRIGNICVAPVLTMRVTSVSVMCKTKAVKGGSRVNRLRHVVAVASSHNVFSRAVRTADGTIFR